jgi:hypothetical protein
MHDQILQQQGGEHNNQVNAIDEAQIGHLSLVVEVPLEYLPIAEPIDWPVEHDDDLTKPRGLQEHEETLAVDEYGIRVVPVLERREDDTAVDGFGEQDVHHGVDVIATVRVTREDEGLDGERGDEHGLVGFFRHRLAVVHEQLDNAAQCETKVHDHVRSIAIDQLPNVVLDVVEARLIPECDVVLAYVFGVCVLDTRGVHAVLHK